MIDTSGVRWDALAIKAEDGGLGFAAVFKDNCIYLWSWKQSDGGRSANGTTRAGGGGRWACFHIDHMTPLPALMVEVIEEILFRLPPEEPAYLVRAALVCKAWRGVLTDSGFLRRYREFHRTPPLLGYLHDSYTAPRFVPTSTAASPFSKLGASWPRVLDCRHGRVLIDLAYHPVSKFTVWDPITGDRKNFVVPTDTYLSHYNAAVLCAMDAGCDHLNCHSGPFRVVLVEKQMLDGEGIAQASVYSSAADAWNTASASIVFRYSIESRPGLLIGDALYFPLYYGVGILKYDLSNHGLSTIETPGVPSGAIAIKAEDGGLGFVAMSRNKTNCIYLMSRQAGGGWVRHKAIELETLLPISPVPSYWPNVVGYVEGTDTIFISIDDVGVFTLELKSRQTKKVGESSNYNYIVPYTSFYTPR
ncbi:hypothetical protein U9M48_011516 [Paspalum notatum var. saurae]|uniref:F-box domain-containing protein n=1 Tax=Paspalum notatum var. saurae TaxID=547442 RepID=A0AAQ3SX85_PASNO